jgi:hypothetical protein
LSDQSPPPSELGLSQNSLPGAHREHNGDGS